MSDNVVEFRKATKLYAGVPAIQDVDFELRRGEIHALVGENGAGKSTLTKEEILRHGHGRHQAVLLEHHGDAEVSCLQRRLRRDIDPVHPHRS